MAGIEVPAASSTTSKHYTEDTCSSTTGLVLNRSSHSTLDSVREIWGTLGMPDEALQALQLPGADEIELPSSFKIGHLAQMSIGLSALAAATIGAKRNATPTTRVTVPIQHACAEFKSERLYTLNGEPGRDPRGAIVGGLHKTSDGVVRIHDGFPNHRDGAFELLGLQAGTASREDVAEKAQDWTAIDLENEATRNRIVIGALRSYREWDALPQSEAIANQPILLKPIGAEKLQSHKRLLPSSHRCLAGLRVVELSRVIAAPVAGKTLAAHGADVVWITSPNLPSLPTLDIDMSRGKRSVQLDIREAGDKERLLELIRTADVFLQGYRPGSLEALGLGSQDLLFLNPSLIIANLSAYGPRGPWAKRRGFDSIVQHVSGLNVSEADHAGKGETVRVLPCQALDHASGYLLATGIMAAVYRRMKEGGAYQVDVSLAGTMKFLRSLGQYEGDSGFQCNDIDTPEAAEYMETKTSEFGVLCAVRHSAAIEGFEVGWEIMPTRLGVSEPLWSNAEDV